MKIRLYAFGDKMFSRIMDVPEGTGPIFKLRLTQPITAISGFDGQKIGENPSFETELEFEWTGKYEGITGEMPKIYQLRDIRKIEMPPYI